MAASDTVCFHVSRPHLLKLVRAARTAVAVAGETRLVVAVAANEVHDGQLQRQVAVATLGCLEEPGAADELVDFLAETLVVLGHLIYALVVLRWSQRLKAT